MTFRFLLWLLVLLASYGAAADTDTNRTAPVFLIAEVWPWGYLDEKGQPAGLITAFASQLSARSGVEMQYRVLPHQRVLANFRRGSGNYTVVFENPALDSFAEQVGKVLESDMLLITERHSNQRLTLRALAGKTLGYISGTYYGKAFHADQEVIKLPLSGIDQAIRMLELNRLDALIASDILLNHSLKQAQLDPQNFRGRVLTRGQPAHLYTVPGDMNAAQVSAVRAALGEMRASGELDRIFRHEMKLPPLTND